MMPPADEQALLSLDDLVATLMRPPLLHHKAKRVQALVLACLRQALRIVRMCEEEKEEPVPDESSGMDDAATKAETKVTRHHDEAETIEHEDQDSASRSSSSAAPSDEMEVQSPDPPPRFVW